MANQPAKKFKIGFVSVTIWANEATTGDARWYTVEVSRTYKDGDDLKNTNALNHADLLVAAHLLQKANAWILEQ